MTRTIFTLLMLVFTFGQLNAQEDASSMSELLRQIDKDRPEILLKLKTEKNVSRLLEMNNKDCLIILVLKEKEKKIKVKNLKILLRKINN